MSYDDHRLDPELRPVIHETRERYANRPPLGTVAPPEMRVRAAQEFERWNSNPVAIAEVTDFSIPAEGTTPAIPCRLYDPVPGGGSGGCLVYFHGGGWVIGDLETEDAALRRIAEAGNIKLLSVDYRLAPENPFPAAIEDGERVFRWLAEAGDTLGIDAGRLAAGGGSAGANVALGTALRLRDSGGPMPIFMLLFFGAFGGGEPMPSHEEFGDGRFILPLVGMNAFWSAYVGNDRSHPHAVPLKADLTGLPPALVAAAELDLLADESTALAERLRAAGGTVDYRLYGGAVHGFTQYANVCALSRRALEEAGRAVSAAIG